MICSEGRRFISKRLNALDQAGRIPNLAGVGASKPPAPRKQKASGGGQMFSSRRIAFVPYQQVQAGVFVQEVRVKTIKVGPTGLLSIVYVDDLLETKSHLQTGYEQEPRDWDRNQGFQRLRAVSSLDPGISCTFRPQYQP